MERKLRDRRDVGVTPFLVLDGREPQLREMGDSGLDIDALKIVASGVNKLKRPDNAQIIITHYQRLLNYIVPDFVHVLFDGRIIRSGGKELALELEEKGYDWIVKHPDDNARKELVAR